jgi:tetratricopeptide (TPR) repeat protein
MINDTIINDNIELITLCNTVRELISKRKLNESEELIRQAMAKYPHAPEPHNLMGIQLENKDDYLSAIKHFRAAWALDPTYTPARYNLEQYADMFCKNRKDAYTVDDCPQEQDKELYKTEYDEKGIGHIVKRNKTNSFIKKK